MFLSKSIFELRKCRQMQYEEKGTTWISSAPRKSCNQKEKCLQFLWNSKNLDNCLQVVNSLSRLQMVYGGSYNERALSLLLHNFLILTPPPPPAQACALRRWRQDQLIFSAGSKRHAPFLTGVRDLGKGQSSDKELLNIIIWLCSWKWDGWRGKGLLGWEFTVSVWQLN